MRLAYYSVAAREEFWTEHWGGHSVDELLAAARTSPLTRLILESLPPRGRVLEAGCGLGQYVLLLRERGIPAAGADWSVEALAACRRVAPVPVAAMDLAALALRDGSFAAYVSLGVVEHDAAGPDAILAEARRVLAPGGTLVVSVPYVTGVRWLATPYLRRRARAVAGRGGAFYQYAFSRAELHAALRRHGFVVRSTRPYDPGRILRTALRRLVSARRRIGSASGVPSETPGPGVPRGARGTAGRALRALLYTRPSLGLFGHMLLAVAAKA